MINILPELVRYAGYIFGLRWFVNSPVIRLRSYMRIPPYCARSLEKLHLMTSQTNLNRVRSMEPCTWPKRRESGFSALWKLLLLCSCSKLRGILKF